jgi:hypothetical protein
MDLSGLTRCVSLWYHNFRHGGTIVGKRLLLKIELECFEFKMHYAKSKAFLVALK